MHKGGTKNESFAVYFENLIKHLKGKYKTEKLVIIMDNLWYRLYTKPLNYCFLGHTRVH